MKPTRTMLYVMLIAALAGTLAGGLSGCGGGGVDGGPTAVPAKQVNGIAVGEPNPAALSVAPFTAMARDADCTQTRNRLFVIDGQRVFWDHAGQCADAAYAQTLFASRPDTVLCSHGDTIAGPRTTCQDESARTLFDTMLAHLDEPDLGLGSSHKVEQVAFLPKAGAPIPFATVAGSRFSGIHTGRKLVIRDLATWQALWAEHGTFQTPAPDLPKVDFTRQTLIAVFADRYGDGCYNYGITGVKAGTDKVVVTVAEQFAPPGTLCAQVATSPMQVVAIARIGADVGVVFEQGAAGAK